MYLEYFVAGEDRGEGNGGACGKWTGSKNRQWSEEIGGI